MCSELSFLPVWTFVTHNTTDNRKITPQPITIVTTEAITHTVFMSGLSDRNTPNSLDTVDVAMIADSCCDQDKDFPISHCPKWVLSLCCFE